MLRRRIWGDFFLASLLLSMTTILAAEEHLTYPKTKRIDHTDDYHGVQVADPYRWLEEDVRKAPAVAEWVAGQNELTFAYLKAIPQRESIHKRLTELWNYERYSAPFKAGGRYFYTKNDGLQNQSVLYTMDSLDGEPRLLIDPNKWSKDGTVALSGLEVSDDGKYLAYGVAEAGSDWNTWHVMDVATGKILADEVKWVKYSGASWTTDSKGFFYGRFEEPKPGEAFQKVTLNQKVYYHRLGTPQSDDVLVYRRPDHPDWGFQTSVTEDGRYLISDHLEGNQSPVSHYLQRSRRAVCDAGRSHRRLRQRIQLRRQRWSGLLLQNRSESAESTTHRHRHAQAGSATTGKRSFPKRRRTSAASGWSAICSSPII